MCHIWCTADCTCWIVYRQARNAVDLMFRLLGGGQRSHGSILGMGYKILIFAVFHIYRSPPRLLASGYWEQFLRG
jgi:hypothetical protein